MIILTERGQGYKTLKQSILDNTFSNIDIDDVDDTNNNDFIVSYEDLRDKIRYYLADYDTDHILHFTTNQNTGFVNHVIILTPTIGNSNGDIYGLRNKNPYVKIDMIRAVRFNVNFIEIRQDDYMKYFDKKIKYLPNSITYEVQFLDNKTILTFTNMTDRRLNLVIKTLCDALIDFGKTVI